jgi:hypothetical protein
MIPPAAEGGDESFVVIVSRGSQQPWRLSIPVGSSQPKARELHARTKLPSRSHAKVGYAISNGTNKSTDKSRHYTPS